MGGEIGPDYRKVIDLIRGGIVSGEYPVGSQIPSTGELRDMTGLSITSVRRAVQRLQADGILEGHPGKGVFVAKMPADADQERADLAAITEQLADLRAKVNLLEAVVMNLCSKAGVEYPHGGARDTTEKAPRRGQAGRR